ncbi:hypothetical protein DTO021D3_1982 [Paecilomyces variotii]|nr:hypothetical protein DTO032I3_8794 [Paecilomyces variotii]KAJ9281323.1 hypothetical protein DTO021D3_1982 [Paecilomyces variotii]KAJ9344987.1 hypothetical protein DTO027B6_2693 [Paecilomyces variotii]KAJ9375515.1 hypothetical protein DTO032I4_9005 [Paecilomyces variotii]
MTLFILTSQFETAQDGHTPTLNDNWASLLPVAQLVYNKSRHSATGIAPAEALMGFIPESRLDVAEEAENAVDRVKRLDDARRTLTEHLQGNHERVHGKSSANP